MTDIQPVHLPPGMNDKLSSSPSKRKYPFYPFHPSPKDENMYSPTQKQKRSMEGRNTCKSELSQPFPGQYRKKGELETHLHEPCDEDHEAFPEDFYSEASLYARPPKLTIPPEGDYQGYAPSPLDDAYHYGIYAETGTAPMPGVGNYTTGSYSYPATSSPYDPPPMPTIPSPYYHSSGGGFSPTVSPAVDHMSMQSPWEGGHSQAPYYYNVGYNSMLSSPSISATSCSSPLMGWQHQESMTPGYSHMMPYYSPMGDGRDHMSDRNLSMDEICGRFRNYISRNPHFPDVSTLAYEIQIPRKRLYDVVNVMEELDIICKDNNSGFQFKGFQKLKDIDQICESFKACRSTAKKSSLQYQLNFVISQLRKQGATINEIMHDLLEDYKSYPNETKTSESTVRRRLYDIMKILEQFDLVSKQIDTQAGSRSAVFHWNGNNLKKKAGLR